MQASSKLHDFLKRQVDKPDKSEIDWESKKKNWMCQVENLYRQIKDFLKEAVDEGLVQRAESSIDLNEEFIGSYSINTLLLKIGKNEVLFTPKGTLIIAGRGRVDMKGPQGDVMLILYGKGERPGISFSVSSGKNRQKEKKVIPQPPAEYEWVVVKSRSQRDWPVLDQESFLDALRVVLGDVESEFDE